jgi:hypothetical protein
LLGSQVANEVVDGLFAGAVGQRQAIHQFRYRGVDEAAALKPQETVMVASRGMGQNAESMDGALGLGSVLGVAMLLTSEAHAHGQFPLPTDILLDREGRNPVVETTFGVLLPTADPDGGYTWICEEMVSTTDSHPAQWLRTAGGTLMAGGRAGLLQFTPSMCGVRLPVGSAQGQVVVMAAHPSRDWVLAALDNGSVHWSHDDGQTFAMLQDPRDDVVAAGALLDGEGPVPRVLLAWRILGNNDQWWWLSEDGGASATQVSLSETRGTWIPIAHDVAHPGHVYVREDGWDADRILRVRLADGAVQAVLREAEDALVVGISADGQHVATGGLVTPLEVSTDHGDSFVARPTLHEARALKWSPSGGLYAAGGNWRDGFAAGVSTDLGGSWQGLGRFADIRGVHACADAGQGCVPGADGCVGGQNDVAAACGPYWQELKTLFGVGKDAGATSPADAGLGVADGSGQDRDAPGGCLEGWSPVWMLWMVPFGRRRRK